MKTINLLHISCSILLLLGTGCKKPELVDIKTEQNRLKGLWKLSEYNVTQYDNITGAKLLSTTQNNVGTLEFKFASNIEADVFNYLTFEGAAAETYIPGFFLGHSADRTTTGGVAIYWDADPESQRIGLWTIEPGGNWYEKADCTGTKSWHKITYIRTDQYTNTRYFYEYNLKR